MPYKVEVSYPLSAGYILGVEICKLLDTSPGDSGAGFGFRDMTFYTDSREEAHKWEDIIRKFFKDKGIEDATAEAKYYSGRREETDEV